MTATPADPARHALVVAQAIHAKAAGPGEPWKDLTGDEQGEFMIIALAAMEAHVQALIADKWTLCPPGTLPAPKTEQEASSMVVAGRKWLEAHPTKPKLILPRRGLH